MKKETRIVLIDSDKDQISSIEKFFSKHAVINVVKSFNDGLEATKYLENNTNLYDVVVMDLLIQNKDGLSIIKNLRDKGINKNIIIMSGYNSLEMIKEEIKKHKDINAEFQDVPMAEQYRESQRLWKRQ